MPCINATARWLLTAPAWHFSLRAGGGLARRARARAGGAGGQVPRGFLLGRRGRCARRGRDCRDAPAGQRGGEGVPARRAAQALPGQLPVADDGVRREGLHRQLLADLRAARAAGAFPATPLLGLQPSTLKTLNPNMIAPRRIIQRVTLGNSIGLTKAQTGCCQGAGRIVVDTCWKEEGIIQLFQPPRAGGPC